MFGQAEGLSYAGLISNVVIYNRVLSPGDALQLATVPASTPFSITSQYLDGEGNMVITWQSLPGATYRVLGTASLAAPVSWTSVSGSILATNTTTSATIPITSGAKFFTVANP